MTEQDYFFFAPESTHFPAPSYTERSRTRPHLQSRTSSTASNAALRELLRPWGTISPTPPSCRTVSFSSWTRFTASTTNTSPIGALKASALCKGNGLAPSYSPPASEWTYLGADQPVEFEKPEDVRRGRHQRQRSSASWPTVSSTNDSGQKTEPIHFRKQELRRVNTSSELTNSLKMPLAPEKQPKNFETMRKKLGIENMTCEGLPSAFDSDSEDEN